MVYCPLSSDEMAGEMVIGEEQRRELNLVRNSIVLGSRVLKLNPTMLGHQFLARLLPETNNPNIFALLRQVDNYAPKNNALGYIIFSFFYDLKGTIGYSIVH